MILDEISLPDELEGSFPQSRQGAKGKPCGLFDFCESVANDFRFPGASKGP
jgi:hypothetical protein